MFTRYWRNYPWFLQLFLFVTMMFTLFWLGRSIVWSVVPLVTGVSIKDVLGMNGSSPLKVVRASLLVNTVIHLFTFSLPPLLFTYLTHPRPVQYLGLRLPGKPVHWLLVTGIMLGYLPLSLALETWLQQFANFGKWARELQTETDTAFGAYLNMRGTADLLKVFAAFALVPPIGEELLFRGIIMRFAHRQSQTAPSLYALVSKQEIRPRKNAMLMPVLLTSVLFTLMHPNPYGAPFIFTAAVLLALIYWLTGSLLCSIWAHLIFNGAQVLGIFLTGHSEPAASNASAQSFPLWLPIAGLALLAASLYGLFKMKTPLPADWSADFSRQELEDARRNAQS